MQRKKKIRKPRFKVPPLAVSDRMKRVRSFGTSIERGMEALLKKKKIRYEKQPSLIGKPDFRIKRTNVLIFCDSSFWHGRKHKEMTGEAFKKNKDFWANKLQNNKKRDARVNRILRGEGWSVLRFWDTDILKNPLKVEVKLMRAIEKNDLAKKK